MSDSSEIRKDFLGNDLHEGDTVSFIMKVGSYGSSQLSYGIIEKINPKLLRVMPVQKDGTPYKSSRYSWAKQVLPENCIKLRRNN